MSPAISVVARDAATSERLVSLIPSDTYTVTTCDPENLPSELPQLFVVALPGIETPEEGVIEHLRANEATANIPIVIVSALPMIELQSVPYASDWTIAIVEEPVNPQILGDTMQFLLNPPSE
jgi:CheY-like chemotaxis protein